MKILFLLCLCGLACALPARQSPWFERFRNIPLFEDDSEGSSEDDGLYEVEERNFVGRRNNRPEVNLERFKNIPLFFLENEDEKPISRNAPKQRNNVKMPLFYYSERPNTPNHRSAPNRLRNVPLIFLNEDPESFDDAYDDDTFEIELEYDDKDEIVPPVYKKPAKRPTKRPQQINRPRPNKPNRPNKRPQKPKPKPSTTTTTTTEKPEIAAAEQFVISETPLSTNQNRINDNDSIKSKRPEVQQYEISEAPLSAYHNSNNVLTDTIEVMKDNELIKIPVPKSLEIVAFITKDGSIYEIDNGEENLLLVGKNNPNSEGLKSIMEKSLKHTINKIFVDEEGSGRSEAIIDVKEDELEPTEIVPAKPTSATIPAVAEKEEQPLFRSVNVDTISTK